MYMFKLKKLEIFLRIIKKNKFCLEVENCCRMAQPSSLIYTQPSLVYGEMECWVLPNVHYYLLKKSNTRGNKLDSLRDIRFCWNVYYRNLSPQSWKIQTDRSKIVFFLKYLLSFNEYVKIWYLQVSAIYSHAPLWNATSNEV